MVQTFVSSGRRLLTELLICAHISPEAMIGRSPVSIVVYLRLSRAQLVVTIRSEDGPTVDDVSLCRYDESDENRFEFGRTKQVRFVMRVLENQSGVYASSNLTERYPRVLQGTVHETTPSSTDDENIILT